MDWSQAAYDAFVAEEKYANPLRAVRVLAMVHIAQHDALAAIRPAYAPHTFVGNVPDADPGHGGGVGRLRGPGRGAARPARGPRRPTGEHAGVGARARGGGERGGSWASKAAAAVRAQRRGDGSDTEAMVRLPPAQRPGAWSPVAPWDIIFAPGWQTLKPFALQSPQQFRVGPPPALEQRRIRQGLQ